MSFLSWYKILFPDVTCILRFCKVYNIYVPPSLAVEADLYISIGLSQKRKTPKSVLIPSNHDNSGFRVDSSN